MCGGYLLFSTSIGHVNRLINPPLSPFHEPLRFRSHRVKEQQKRKENTRLEKRLELQEHSFFRGVSGVIKKKWHQIPYFLFLLFAPHSCDASSHFSPGHNRRWQWLFFMFPSPARLLLVSLLLYPTSYIVIARETYFFRH